MPTSLISRGVVYIAVGPGYTQQAISSAGSVREFSPGLKIHLFTDQPDISSLFLDGITRIENPHIRSKVDYIHQTPFDSTLYLDADTRIVTDITGMFDILERFDLAIAHAHQRNHFATQQTWRVPIPDAFPQMNGGVLLFRKNEATIQLLKDWQQAYHQNAFGKDQVTLRELIWSSDLRIAILPPEYNIRYKKYLEVWSEEEARPYILHMAKYKVKDPAMRKKELSLRDKLNWRLKKIRWIWKQVKSLG